MLSNFWTLDGRPLLLALVGRAVKLEEGMSRVPGCLLLLLLLLPRSMRHMILALLGYNFSSSFGRLEAEGDGGIVVSHGAVGVYPLQVITCKVVGGGGQYLLNLYGRPILRHLLLPVMLSYQLVPPLTVEPAEGSIVAGPVAT